MSSTPSTPRPYLDEQGRTDAEVYLTDIYDGKIIACKYMRKLSEIVLPWFEDEYHGYHFDVDKALRPVKFIERFCCFPEGEKMGRPFLMEPFQRAAIELAYGFVGEDGLRKTRSVHMMLARKNGKTSLLAALNLYMLTSDGEKGAEVYNCANGESQARKCYAAADQMRLHSPFLKNRIRRGMAQKRGKSALNYDKNGSMLIALASNPEKLDSLSASFIVYDEMAAATDNGALLDVMEESVSSRKQPLTWVISTENYIRDNIWDERMSYCKNWLDGKIDDDTLLPLLYCLDSRDEIYDPRMWIKANPGINTIKEADNLRQRVNLAKQSPGRLPSLLTKEFNLVAGAYSSYLDVEDCVNKTPIDFDVSEAAYYALSAFDLAVKDDLCACVTRFLRRGDPNIYELARFWIPSSKVNMMTDAKQKDNVPYLQWASQGWVEIVEGDRVNNYVIIDYLRELVDEGIYPFAVAFDPWHVDDALTRDLERLIGSSRTVPVPQTARVISPLMKEHKLDLKAHRVICPNPCLHHCRTAVQARVDNNDNVFPKRRDIKHKIDGFMAELFSLHAFNKFKEEYLSSIGWDTYDKDMPALLAARDTSPSTSSMS